MDQGTRRRKLRAPSPAMIVALVALVFAMSGTAVAASKLVNGDKLIKKASLSGNRLRSQTVNGSKIKLSTLGKVTSAALADTIADGAVGTTKIGALPGACVRSNASQTIASNSLTALTFNTVDSNVGGVFNASQPTQLTAPAAGTYVITASVEWSNGFGGSRGLTIQLNGSTSLAMVDGPTNLDGTLDQNVATTCHLNAGDYVRAMLWQTSGTARDSWYAPSSSPLFTMNWIGP